MRNVLAIAGKELRHYFHSPIAYLAMTVWAALCGVVFYILTAAFVSQALRMQMMGGMGAPPLSINEFVVRPMLQGILMVVLVFLLPLITMRLYAEEKRSGTIELLLTSPLTDLQIILGKYLGALVLYAVLIAITFLYISVLFFFGNPHARPLIANALGLLLFGAALLALGMWFSTFTKNQIMAGILSMVVFLLLFIADWPQNFSSSMPVRVLAYMSLSNHLENFAKGVIDLGDVVYYLSGVALGIFLTARSVDALKGRA
jgi:ABC-2 type transport system permease protein